ncbi:activating transcription factor 7-interacting protein 2 isoform X2 [Bos indicus x Bos taurus]|uniref:Activating transcription factor 7 interacting protein 2 n=1 Tax=Bos taurus TaxID=9913 RepID=A0A3Q1M0G9_BOVIN|nr:activating transcription factor 7-interacting protein 2 isoform X2 [Bos taurus]XP_027383226.1 activating transcription factor 7-interacting protein 2 isoform X2 [Bos indicus x Bos taurus]
MASPDRSKRKILKAKKTMPVSCRKQVEILNKSRNVEALKTAAIENNISSGNQKSSTDVISSKCRHSENDASSLNSIKNSVCGPKSKEFSQNLIKPLEITDSETRLEYTEEQVVYPYEKPSKTEFPGKLFIHKAKASQNTSENHFECQASVTRSFFEHEEDCNLKSICHLSSVLSDIVQIPKSTKTNTLDDKRIDKIVSYLEANSSAELYDKKQSDILVFSSDDPFVPGDKIPKLVNSVISSNCADDILKSEESYRTCLSSILSCENIDAEWLSSRDTDSNNSHNQKKRMFSENKENVKRMKTSEQINENISVALEKQTALLEQVRHLVRQEIYSISYKLFDNKLRELTERIGKTQCKNKHEAIADELFVANSETMNLDKNPESVNSPQERETVKSETTNYSEKASEKINWSREPNEAVSESNNDVLLISVESPNLTIPVASNPTATGKIASGNSNNSADAEKRAMAIEKKKYDSVIDLTKDDLSNCSTESPVSTLESPVKAVSVSKETTPVSQNAAQVCESFEHLPPLPEPPLPLSELADKVRDTLPPQKPELKVKRVLRPRGIALTWNITKINPKCAPVESYHLFLCHENPSNKLIWKKIGEIKALPLPMACTLSKFLASSKYYFTVQSKDIFGRYGPFCDIKSIPGFSENLT